MFSKLIKETNFGPTEDLIISNNGMAFVVVFQKACEFAELQSNFAVYLLPECMTPHLDLQILKFGLH